MLSRVADNLYWLSRYLERVEHTARLLDVNLDEILDAAPTAGAQRWDLLFNSLHLEKARPQYAKNSYPTAEVVKFLTLDSKNSASLISCLATARENARQVREQISSEMWFQLNRFYQDVQSFKLKKIMDNPHEFLHSVVKEGVQTFRGVTDATMPHGEGWHFIQLGCFVERAQSTSTILDEFFSLGEEKWESLRPYEQDLALAALLKSCTSFEAYCKEHTAQLQTNWVAEFLFLNAESPRSMRFAADRILDSAKAIASSTNKQKRDTVTRTAGRLSSSLDYGSIDEIMDEGLHEYCADIQVKCLKIHQAIYDRYIQPKGIVS